MRLKLGLLILCFIMAVAEQAKAQVAIGSDEPAERFAALQIDGVNQGLRLSRLTTTERDNLNVSTNAKAKGLVIYNTTSESIEFYDGTQWRTLIDPDSKIQNGLFLAPLEKIELGGNLTEATTIAQGVSPMTFTTNGGTLSVNTNVLAVNNSTVAVNADNFTVKNGSTDVFKITKSGATNAITFSGLLDVNSGALNVTGTKTTINGIFRYVDGAQGAGKVLTSNAAGIASWQTLQSSTSTLNFVLSLAELSPASMPATSNALGTTYKAITNNLTLTQGKWIIAGMLYTYVFNRATTGTNVPLIKMRVTTSAGVALTPETGNLTELKSASNSRDSGAFSAIPMTFMIEVPAGGLTVQIQAYSSMALSNTNRGVYLTRGHAWLNPSWGSRFQATRIND